MVWLLMRGDFPRALQTKRVGAHLVRSIAGIGSMFCMFASYILLPLADATAIGYAAPLMITLLAAYFLGERMSALRWGAVAVGFCGVLVMLWEHIGSPAPGAPARSAAGAGFALAGAFLVSIAMVQTRRLTKTEDTGAITFYFQTTTTVAGVIALTTAALWPATWPGAAVINAQAWIPPTLADWGPLIGIGLLGGIGQIFMTQGYRYADASVLAIFDYSSLLFAVAIGFVVFGDVPTSRTILGAAIVIAAGLAVVLHESGKRGKAAG
jgi:drug/metabolite transporter (DMT)-like permease